MNQQLLDQMARYAQVLSNPKRLEIIATLEKGETTAGDLAKAVDITMPNLSQHLTLMKQHGIVKSRKEGLNQYYALTGQVHMDVVGALKFAVIANPEQTRALYEAVTG